MANGKVIVMARTIDGPMFYNREFDSMSEDRSDATELHPDAAEAVIASLNSHREGCKTGEAWDNSYHRVQAIPA